MTPLHTEHEVEPSEQEPGLAPAQQPKHHVQDFILSDWSLSASLGLTDFLSPEIILPVQLNRQRAKFTNDAGAELTGFESIHHQNETLFGIGDLELATRLRLLRAELENPWSFALRLGLTVPTGRTEPNPFTLGRQGIRHQHMFFGTGTFDPVVGVEASYALSDVTFLGWTRTRTSLYQNSKGFKGGTRMSAGIGIESSLGLESFRFRFQPEVYHETPAIWEGDPAENSGRTDIIPAIGASWTISPDASLALLFKLPQTVRVVGGQLKQSLVTFLGFAYTLDAFQTSESKR